MRTLFSLLLLTAFLLSACAPETPDPLPVGSLPTSSATQQHLRTQTSSPPAQTVTESPTPTPTLAPATPTTVTVAAPTFAFQPGRSLPPDRTLIAIEAGSTEDKSLLLADPSENTVYKFSFPPTAHFATPFLAGLSPDARYFVYFEGGWLETLYEVEHLRASTPDLVLNILDLRSSEVIFSTPLLSPSFPQDLSQVAETIQDDWWFEDHPFSDVVDATQEMLLDNIRRVAWSPDGSLLAFASQDPGPSSDLYLFNLENRAAQLLITEPGHVLRSNWAPDSSALILVTSLYNRHAREDSTYLLTREGALLTSFTSQIWYFAGWHDAKHAILYGATDSGDYFEPKAISTTDGSTTTLWEGSFADIAFSPDLSTILLSSNMPSAPKPPDSGLYLVRSGDENLLALSDIMGWGVAYWGSERFAFAASSLEEGTIGVTPGGERQTIGDGYWRLSASPGGSYLTGYQRVRHGMLPGVVSGLRIFDGRGSPLVSLDDINVDCALWDRAGTAMAYQVENRLYLWQAAGLTRLVSDQLNQERCAVDWVLDAP